MQKPLSEKMDTEPFRPQFHFSPPAYWLNDPNGLLFYKGEYHLFYQHYPEDIVWGPMHWGHAVSVDLVNWTHLPIALYPDDHGYIFSGSAVIDWENTAVFGPEAMVAIFTHHNPGDLKQSQSIAYSLDRGRTWTKYAGNPVIPTPDDLRDFRDPKVFWYEDGQTTGHWVMLLATRNAILFYTSPNLVEWEACGSFGFGHGATDGVWETPDLFLLPIDGGGESRWVLTVGVGDGAPAGGTGTQYFVGKFDGQTFTSENLEKTVLWADWGADFYAAQSWNDVGGQGSGDPESGDPELGNPGSGNQGLGNRRLMGRRIWLAWFNNWSYAAVTPTSTWRGAMSLPRAVNLTKTQDGLRLVQKPIVELEQLRNKHEVWHAIIIGPTTPFAPDIQGNLLEIIAEFKIEPGADVARLGIRIQTGAREATMIGYRLKSHILFIDRTHSGKVDFSPDFSGLHMVKMPPVNNEICLHIFVDRSSIELFGNNGLVSMSSRIFPMQRPFRLEFFADGGQVEMNVLNVYHLKAASFRTVEKDES